MEHTNLIKSSNNLNIDLYTDFILLLKQKIINKNWCNLIDRKFVKKIIMIIPYGSTFFGQQEMLLEVLKEQFFTNNVFKLELLEYLIQSKMLIGTEIIKDTFSPTFNNRLICCSKKSIDLSDIIKVLQEDL